MVSLSNREGHERINRISYDKRRRRPSVPILKFLFNFRVNGKGAPAEALDGGQDIVGALDPAEGFWVGVASLDIGLDRCFEFGRGAMSAAFDLLFGQEREEPLDLVDP